MNIFQLLLLNFSQALWRYVQTHGCVIPYSKDKKFRIFVRSCAALPFLAINEIESAIDVLREWRFKETSPFYDQMVQFVGKFCQYIEDVWIQYVLYFVYILSSKSISL